MSFLPFQIAFLLNFKRETIKKGVIIYLQGLLTIGLYTQSLRKSQRTSIIIIINIRQVKTIQLIKFNTNL